MLKMIESYLKTLIGIGRSKPFLLFVIILLTGFIYLHFSAEGSQLSVPSHVFGVSQAKFNQFTNFLRSENTSHVVIENTTDVLLNDTLEAPVSDVRFGRKCKKKIDVSFLKVHKAGSTTVMNIFLRFAISNKLNIVLPPKSEGFGFNYLGYGKTVSRDRIIPLPNNESYNILCNHVVYNKSAFRSIMPKDTVYVGILREPKSHFNSAGSYYGFFSHLKNYAAEHNLSLRSSVISEFLQNENRFKVGTYFVYNRMSFDFGIPKALFHNDAFVDSYIEVLDKDYGLVMIMERFAESLILLKRLLCWNTKDILYVPLNAQHKSSRDKMVFSTEDAQRLKRWNSADFKLYDHFIRVFEAKVKAGGSDLQEEVESFGEIQEMVKQFCSSKVRQAPVLTIPRNKWEESFNVSQGDCDLMTENELSMMQRLIKHAWDRYSKTKPETETQANDSDDFDESQY